MSKSRIAIAVFLLATAMSSAAFGKGAGGGGHGGGGHGGGRFGGMHFGGVHFGGHGGVHLGGGHAHFGGGHHGGAKFAFSRRGFRGHSFAAHHGGVNFHARSARVRAVSIHNGLKSLSRAGGLRHWQWLSSPAARTQVVAAAALAGWHGGHGANGWWRHGDGGYGWIGSLFWPFAYYDIYDYAIFGDSIGFWDYGYPDIYAGIFAPYGYDDLEGYRGQHWRGRAHRDGVPSIARVCGDDAREVAGLPIDQIEQAIEPNDAQRAAVDELANASMQAAETIRAACPARLVLTAPGRLAAMQQRIEAMISAVALVRTPLEKVYSLLDDEQKARLNALAEDQRKAAPLRASLAQNCGNAQASAFQWPQSEIEARLQPNDTQRAALEVLQDASGKAAEMLNNACQPNDALTPPARLAAAAKRLGAMLEALKQVRPALEDFYASLSDEQKAQFEAIGPRRAA